MARPTRFYLDGEMHTIERPDIVTVFGGAQCDGCGYADGLELNYQRRTARYFLVCPECGDIFYETEN